MQLNYLKKHLHPSNNRNCSLDYSFSNSNIITNNNTNNSLYTLTYNNSNLSNKFLPKNNLSRNLPNRKNNSVESTLSINKKTSSNVSQENIILNNNYLAKENEKLHKLNSIYNKTNLMLKEKLNNYVYNKYTNNYSKINRFSSGNLLINNNGYKNEIELENNIKLLKNENFQLKNKIENLTNLLLIKENEIKLLNEKLSNNNNNLNTMNEILNKLKLFLENNENNENKNNNIKNKNKKIPNCKLNFKLKKLNNNNNINIKRKEDEIDNKINYILKSNEEKNEQISEIQNKLSDIFNILYNNNLNNQNNNNHNNFFNSPNHSSLFTPPLNRNKSSFYFSNSKKNYNNNFKNNNNNNSISYIENPEESNFIQNKTLSELYSENKILKKQLETINEINYISNDKKIQNLQDENERLITENELLKNECDKVNLKFDQILKQNLINNNDNSQSDLNNSIINNNNNNKYLFQIYDKTKILRFNLNSFSYEIIEPADYDNYKQIISETNIKNIIIYNTLDKLFILIGKESNYLFCYDNNNMSLNKLIKFEYNHNLGGLIYNENINSIIAISGKNCNKCEIFNLKKKKLSLLPDDKYYRGESIFMLYNNILFCMFGFDYKENKFINEIECINFNNDDENNNKKEYFWKNYCFKFKDKIINDNINNNCYNFNIKNGICMQLLNNEILILSKYNNNNILKLNIIENEIEELNNENFLNGFNDNFKGIQEFILLKNNNDNNNNNEYLVNIDNNYNVHILQLNNFEYNIYNYN